MRKIQQRHILSRLTELERLQEANSFMDCLRTANETIGTIESLTGAQAQTGALLKEYRDLLSQKSAGKVDGKYFKYLRKHLIKTISSAKGEFKPDRIEVAFFPYKAAMADSLESIYFAAKAAPNCDAYWVPVPYYDYNANHTLGKMHYDGDKYPTRFKAVDWRKYDVKTRHPDVIFFHNPYDKNNLVTCVHPDFQAERLKDHTDMLVYLPYFVAGDEVAEHFCVLPGTIYADKVIVQSKNVRQSYIRAFGKWAQKSGITINHPLWPKVAKPAEKFVALGSPKFDAVINAKREDFELPEEWRRLIEKPDGSLKKVIMYNQTFTSFADAEADVKIRKLRSVLEIFKNRDDVVLWWRPHPLNFECLKAMRPQYYRNYEETVLEYRRDGWCIYDDTEDLHRAVAWSDA